MGVLVSATDIGTINTEVIHPGFSVQMANYQDELDKLVENLLFSENRIVLRLDVIDEMTRLSIKAQNQVKEVFER